MCKVRWNWHSDSGEEVENVKDIETDAIQKEIKKSSWAFSTFQLQLEHRWNLYSSEKCFGRWILIRDGYKAVSQKYNIVQTYVIGMFIFHKSADSYM